ncbi:LamG domain protein jellyroll fold domain protein [Nitrosomonas sp. Is79A3]|uniref:LamG-like jellyroll fold domain-containing protein n=1 Tax=Nitrosomonas sp. (strain Is79A3) TaxID=261292 RepID=UPI000215C94E
MFHKILLNILLMLTAASLAAPSAVFAVQNCVMPPDGMVGWWPGDGNANDIVGGDNGILQGGAAFGTGIVGQAFQLNGSTNYVEVPDSQSLDVSTAITIQAWVYINAFPTYPSPPTGLNMQVFQKTSNQTLQAYSLVILGDGGIYAGYESPDNPYGAGTLQPRKFGLELTVDGQWAIGRWSNTELQEHTWYHLVTTYDGSVVKVYLNGQLDASSPLTGEIEINDKPAAIGAFGFTNGGPTFDYFNGTIDEVQIFNRALSASEIAAAYNAGSAGNCKVSTPLVAADCKKGGWQALTRADSSPFKNQGDCIQYVNTGK